MLTTCENSDPEIEVGCSKKKICVCFLIILKKGSAFSDELF